MTRKYTISILVDNEAGVLARIVALFSSCQYNIDTLNVSAINPDKSLSKITLTTQADEKLMTQIKKQIEKVIPVQSVTHIEIDESIHRELALVKIDIKDKECIYSSFQAKLIKETDSYCVFEIAGASAFLDSFLEKIPTLDISRTGLIAV